MALNSRKTGVEPELKKMTVNSRYFTARLMKWNEFENFREMPWKGEKDPYKIWLSEIILQQTRVDQGLNYYNRFIEAYPTIEKMAAAPEKAIFKLWEGLGYYTRCKNLIVTSRFIAKQKKGIFPVDYQAILALKGVGPYTAAAIASFAFNLPYAVVDGNVFRVLARFFGIDADISQTTGKNLFTSLAAALLDKKKPGLYNQAIMDLGAVICKPRNPNCTQCPLKNNCVALKQESIYQLPVKSAKLKKKQRVFYYFLIEYGGKLFVRKRGPKDIWENLHEFMLVETTRLIPVSALKSGKMLLELGIKQQLELISISPLYKQQLTHQTIQGRFIYCKASRAISIEGYKAVSFKQLAKLAFPKFITGFMAKKESGAFAV